MWSGDRVLCWNETWHFITEILREPSSHLVSAMNGDRYVPDPAERSAWAVFEQWLNTQLPRGTGHKKVPRPWHGTKPSYREVSATELTPARVERRAKLDALF